MKEAPDTLERIQRSARAEFSEKGYLGASLRRITKQAGVTTGAFYGYYASKEALYSALVGPHYDELMRIYCGGQQAFADLPPERQPEHMGKISGDCMDEMMEYMFQHPQEVRMLLLCSEGTRYEHMIHEMAEIEVESTHRFLAVLSALGKPAPEIDPKLEHMLISGMFTAFFEMIIHEMPYEQAKRYLHELRAFYTAGWSHIMGVDLPQ